MRLAALLATLALAGGVLAQDVTIRVATFNVEDLRTSELVRNDVPRAQRLAETLQRLRPNIVLINEIAYDLPGAPDCPPEGEGRNARRFVEHYLSFAQAEGLEPLRYTAFMAPVNTGMPSGFDLDNDGQTVTEFPAPGRAKADGSYPEAPAEARAYGNDCWGFGTFPGQYGMALLVDERLEILTDEVRTFRKLPWNYMNGALLPETESGEPWYSEEELVYMRLSSKSHWDVPVRLPNGSVVHLLCSHPTPPAFDGPEQRNVRRNHDEIRFWNDYLSSASYIVDDDERPGGLLRGQAFIILGDLNADPDEGDAMTESLDDLLANRRIDARLVPMATEPVDGLDADDTAQWGRRVDYILPSTNLLPLEAGVWRTAPLERAGQSGFPSDHFPVWMKLTVPAPAP
ncbi:MAG: endonuclease/exonuclease/phosphatase family protein [Phycisphaerales bacterium JB039]